MNKREFIKKVLAGERSDRIPRALFGAGRWAYRQTGLRADRLNEDPLSFAEALAGFFRDLDTDIVFPGSGLNTFPAEAIGGEPAFREEQTPLLSVPLIQKTGDAQYLEHVNLDASPQTRALVEMIRHLRRSLPDRYLCATSWGPFTWGMILCDWNMLRVKTATDQEFIREVCNLGVRLSSAFFTALVEENLVDGICISDGAATLIPLDLYQDVVLPAQRKLFSQFQGRETGRFFHQCGNIQAQLALYPEAGPDCITLDAVVKIGEAYELYHDRVVTAGNVDVIRTVFGGDHAAICKAVSDCISEISDPFRKFILMPSCDLPPDTPIQNVKAFLSCADSA